MIQVFHWIEPKVTATTTKKITFKKSIYTSLGSRFQLFWCMMMTFPVKENGSFDFPFTFSFSLLIFISSSFHFFPIILSLVWINQKKNPSAKHSINNKYWLNKNEINTGTYSVFIAHWIRVNGLMICCVNWFYSKFYVRHAKNEFMKSPYTFGRFGCALWSYQSLFMPAQ